MNPVKWIFRYGDAVEQGDPKALAWLPIIIPAAVIAFFMWLGVSFIALGESLYWLLRLVDKLIGK